MSPVEGFLCSGTQAGEFAPIELILLYSIYSLHLACLYIWRILVGQDSCILLLNTPGILLVSFYAAEFQILYSWAAHNENFILLLTAETKRDAWCWPWGLSGWHSAEDSPQSNFGWDPQMQMQVQLNLASGVAWQSGSSSWGTAVCSPKSQFIAEAVTAGKEQVVVLVGTDFVQAAGLAGPPAVQCWGQGPALPAPTQTTARACFIRSLHVAPWTHQCSKLKMKL